MWAVLTGLLFDAEFILADHAPGCARCRRRKSAGNRTPCVQAELDRYWATCNAPGLFGFVSVCELLGLDSSLIRAKWRRAGLL